MDLHPYDIVHHNTTRHDKLFNTQPYQNFILFLLFERLNIHILTYSPWLTSFNIYA
jgi:hypothetical protein